jgi:hypothetical protein
VSTWELDINVLRNIAAQEQKRLLENYDRLAERRLRLKSESFSVGDIFTEEIGNQDWLIIDENPKTGKFIVVGIYEYDELVKATAGSVEIEDTIPVCFLHGWDKPVIWTIEYEEMNIDDLTEMEAIRFDTLYDVVLEPLQGIWRRIHVEHVKTDKSYLLN